MSTSASSVRSGMNPTFVGTSGVDLIDVVRRVWGVDGAKLRSDLDALKRAGLDEKVRSTHFRLKHLLTPFLFSGLPL